MFKILFVCVRVLGVGWGVDGSWMPLPTRPKRYCDPVPLVRRIIPDISLYFFKKKTSPSTRTIDVLLHENCDAGEELEALYFAASLRTDLDLRCNSSSISPTIAVSSIGVFDPSVASEAELTRYLEGVKTQVDGTFQGFRSKLAHAGWDVQRHHFDSKEFRFSVKSADDGTHRD